MLLSMIDLVKEFLCVSVQMDPTHIWVNKREEHISPNKIYRRRKCEILMKMMYINV